MLDCTIFFVVDAAPLSSSVFTPCSYSCLTTTSGFRGAGSLSSGRGGIDFIWCSSSSTAFLRAVQFGSPTTVEKRVSTFREEFLHAWHLLKRDHQLIGVRVDVLSPRVWPRRVMSFSYSPYSDKESLLARRKSI